MPYHSDPISSEWIVTRALEHAKHPSIADASTTTRRLPKHYRSPTLGLLKAKMDVFPIIIIGTSFSPLTVAPTNARRSSAPAADLVASHSLASHSIAGSTYIKVVK